MSKLHFRWHFLFWSMMFSVLVLSLLPTPDHLPSTGWDKSNHLLAFASLFLVGQKAYTNLLRLTLGLLFFGGLIEALQHQTTYRYAEWGDLVADAAGLALGILLSMLLRKAFG